MISSDQFVFPSSQVLKQKFYSVKFNFTKNYLKKVLKVICFVRVLIIFIHLSIINDCICNRIQRN